MNADNVPFTCPLYSGTYLAYYLHPPPCLKSGDPEPGSAEPLEARCGGEGLSRSHSNMGKAEVPAVMWVPEP